MTTHPVPMYQGEDFAQQLSYFTDLEQSVPLVFTHPVMDLRDQSGALLARFDDTGEQLGDATVTAPGVLVLSMPYAQTALIPAGSYPVDIFADVADVREAITKKGVLVVKVSARITVDTGP